MSNSSDSSSSTNSPTNSSSNSSSYSCFLTYTCARDLKLGTHLEESIQAFVKTKVWFDLNLYLYLMVWLDIGCFAHTYARDLKFGTHLGRVNWYIFLTWTWTLNLNFNSNISALGLVLLKNMMRMLMKHKYAHKQIFNIKWGCKFLFYNNFNEWLLFMSSLIQKVPYLLYWLPSVL